MRGAAGGGATSAAAGRDTGRMAGAVSIGRTRVMSRGGKGAGGGGLTEADATGRASRSS